MLMQPQLLNLIPLMVRLQQHAQQQPHQLALQDHQRSLTYAELYHEVSQLSLQFCQMTSPRIAIQLDNSVQWVVTDLAILAANAVQPTVAIPIPSFFSAQQQQQVLLDSGANLLIDAAGMQQLPVAQPAPPLPLGTVKVTYTSGSTGTPKGVCLSAQNIQTTLVALDQRLGELAVRKHLSLMPLAVLLENLAGVYLSLWRGYQVQLQPGAKLGLHGAHELQLSSFFQALNQLQPHSLIVTPGLVKALVYGVQQQYLKLPDLQLVAVGGARLLPELERQALALKIPLVQGYGLSEFGSVVCFNQPATSTSTDQVGTVGKPLDHAKVWLEQGEVVVSGNAMLGYLHDPSSWYPTCIRTGDWGEFDEHGRLLIKGRKKHIIVTEFGRNLDPEWVEAELTEQPEIYQAAVFGSETLPLTGIIVAAAEVSDSAINAAIAEVNQSLPDYARLHAWHRADSAFSINNAQLTGTGRLRRAEIAKVYAHYLSSERLFV
ncbi:MAG: AMP-binding protein [Pseudidiomarina maritima]|nr:AMP-binding protein [Pseudidiomarina maritima]